MFNTCCQSPNTGTCTSWPHCAKQVPKYYMADSLTISPLVIFQCTRPGSGTNAGTRILSWLHEKLPSTMAESLAKEVRLLRGLVKADNVLLVVAPASHHQMR